MSSQNLNEIIGDNDQIVARAEHLEKLRELVGNVYPNRYERTEITGAEDTISALVAFAEPIKNQFITTKTEDGKPNDEEREAANAKLKEFGSVRASGRLAVPPRVMGKAAFVHLSDGVERLQIYVRKQDVKAINNDTRILIEAENSGWNLFNLLDHGDFVGVEGYLFVTKTGELSIHVETIQFLAKAMLPMPDKFHGIEDAEIKQRQRYADLIASSLKVEREPNELTTREVFERRARLISGMRSYLDAHGYIEVETPMLTPKATGAAARPFETHHKALDIPLFARIAPELYLKRLVVGGFEKVYELNRNFRNEGISTRHNPEFTMLEFYCAYLDVNGMMDFAETMIKESVLKATNSLQIEFGKNTINFDKFERVSMKDAIVKNLNKSFLNLGDDVFDESWFDDIFKLRSLKKLLLQHYGDNVFGDNWDKAKIDESWLIFNEMARTGKLGYNLPEEVEKGKQITEIFEIVAEENLIQPTFIIDYPKSISPLSKASPENPNVAERFELFINGMECANGFSELNDPAEQLERFLDQGKERERGDDEAMVLDEDYIRALAYGMPPAAGIGIGIDRLVMLLTNRQSIRDVILFPHLRPERKQTEETENNIEKQGEK